MNLPEDLYLNTSFSTSLPGMQLAIDSTSLGLFKECPRKYYYSIICGWQTKDDNVHLIFGLAIHSAREQYDHAKAKGLSHDEALSRTVHQALIDTWNKDLNRPWLSGDPNKNRETLIRSIIWWLDKFEDDPFTTVIGRDGKPLVELSFRFDSGIRTASFSEVISICGHGDRIAQAKDESKFWLDVKTTKNQLNAAFFAQFSPHNQFSLYDLAGKAIYSVPTQGVVVDGLQVGATFTRSARHFVPKTDMQREEWLKDFAHYARQMESMAEERYWPMNDTACNMYFGCQFRKVCSRGPSVRETWLKDEFRKRTWDPLQRRGDI